MKQKSTYRPVLSGLLTATGILLPLLTAHSFGIPGTVLLPMHIPVFLIGLLCGPFYGAVGGLIIPLLSSALTGMPPFFPMLPLMSGELFTYGFVSGQLYRQTRRPLLLSIIAAMFFGRLVYGIIFAIMLTAGNGSVKALSVSGAFFQGLPGIVLQLILLPVIVRAVSHFIPNMEETPSLTSDEFKQAHQLVQNNEFSCIVIKNGKLVYKEKGPGVAPLISLYEKEPQLLKDAFVVDKVIGKAAAVILVLGNARKVYAEVISTAARSYLTEHLIFPEYGKCVDMISNRAGNGICPLEKSIMDVDNPKSAYEQLKKIIGKKH